MGDEPDGTSGFAQQAMDAVTSGRIEIHPARYAKSYLDWLGEKRDWCISRQLWWGHRIPIWHCGTCTEGELEKALAGRDDVVWRAGESGGWLLCAETDLRGDELGAAHTLAQDPDVLDTWFSSALWPHSTLGWPDETPELKRFYPTSVLSTARDIITLWVARMVIFGLFNRGDVPFRDVYIHPIIQDGKGRRMSKSAGNGVDPNDIMEIHGADALRFTLASGATETQDLRIAVEPFKLPDGRVINTSERFEQGRNFANKFWNAARLTLMNLKDYAPAALHPRSLAIEDRWILDRLDCTIEEVTSDFEQYHFAEAVRRLRDFTWGDFCDWYLEFVKGRLRNDQSKPDAQRVLAAVLDSLCRLLHPIVPFVTEQVWQGLNALAPERGLSKPEPAAESVCIAPWPEPIGFRDETARETVGLWCEVIKALRNLKAERNVPKEARIEPILVARGAVMASLAQGEAFLKSLLPALSVTIVSDVERPADCAVAVLPDVEVILPLKGLIDHEAERTKQRKALADFERQIGALKTKLSNESYVARAPAEVVAETRAKLAELESQRAAVSSLLQEA
jgi:valyl-tRNA synthetase